MILEGLSIPKAPMDALMLNPEEPVEIRLNGSRATVQVGIPEYRDRVAAHYRNAIRGEIGEFAKGMRLPLTFRHFGIVCEFAEPTEIALHDAEVLDDGVRALVTRFGPVFLRNASLPRNCRTEGHKGRFADLNFHIDRSARQETQYSLYFRNPDDPTQREPRTASTLFVANLVAFLQDARESGVRPKPCDELVNNHTLFSGEDLTQLIGDIIFEQPWSAPTGSGEIGVQHNAFVRHACWRRGLFAKGWPIGVRFLK